MSTSPDSAVPTADRIHDVRRIEAAMRRAVREALRQHKHAGNPIATWRNGKVEWVQPEDIVIGADGPDHERS